MQNSGTKAERRQMAEAHTNRHKENSPFPPSPKTVASISHLFGLKEDSQLISQVSGIFIKAYKTLTCPLGSHCSKSVHKAKVPPLPSSHETHEPFVVCSLCCVLRKTLMLSLWLSTFLTYRNIKPSTHAGQSLQLWVLPEKHLSLCSGSSYYSTPSPWTLRLPSNKVV